MVQRNLLKNSAILLFFFLVKNTSGQQLHRQMLSSMGTSTTLNSGINVLQTVGQQSVTGNATVNKLTLQQGFQQSLIAKFLPVYSVNTTATTVYPNPFFGVINIKFSQLIEGNMSVLLYNMFGVLIYKEEKLQPPQYMSFNFEHLPSGSYVLHLSAKNYAFSKTLIKQ